MAASYDTTNAYDTINAYDTGGGVIVASIYEIQQSLNILAYGAFPPASGGIRDAQQAANDYAGTTGLDIQAALNCKHYGVTSVAGLAGHQIYDIQGVANLLNSSTGLDTQGALSQLAGGAA